MRKNMILEDITELGPHTFVYTNLGSFTVPRGYGSEQINTMIQDFNDNKRVLNLTKGKQDD